jgi:hypothetical protein
MGIMAVEIRSAGSTMGSSSPCASATEAVGMVRSAETVMTRVMHTMHNPQTMTMVFDASNLLTLFSRILPFDPDRTFDVWDSSLRCKII